MAPEGMEGRRRRGRGPRRTVGRDEVPPRVDTTIEHPPATHEPIPAVHAHTAGHGPEGTTHAAHDESAHSHRADHVHGGHAGHDAHPVDHGHGSHAEHHATRGEHTGHAHDRGDHAHRTSHNHGAHAAVHASHESHASSGPSPIAYAGTRRGVLGWLGLGLFAPVAIGAMGLYYGVKIAKPILGPPAEGLLDFLKGVGDNFKKQFSRSGGGGGGSPKPKSGGGGGHGHGH